MWNQWMNELEKLWRSGSVEPLRDLGEAMAVSDRRKEAMVLWQQVCENEAPWADGGRVKSMDLLPAMAAEVSRLALAEADWQVQGGARAAYLDRQMQKVKELLRRSLADAVAKGGLVLKPCVVGKELSVETVPAQRFFPLQVAADGKIVGAAFAEQIRRGRDTLTRVEEHRLTDRGVLVRNRAFLAGAGGALWREVDLAPIPMWAHLEKEVLVQNRLAPLFVYLKMPFGDPAEPDCPLGASIGAGAMALLEEADRQYSRLLWEYEGGELAVDADSTYLTGGRMPQTTRRLFRSLNTGADFYKVYNPTLRDESLRAGLNDLLRRVEFACGLSYGILSDPQQKVLTATEVAASRQRLYSTVKQLQGALQQSLQELCSLLDFWAEQLGVLAGRYDLVCRWDDSIVTDAAAEKELFIKQIETGICQPWEYRVRFFGESEETAKSRCGLDEKEE